MFELMIALLRLRCDPQVADDALFQRVLKRLVHTWCQCCEEQLEKHFQKTCPDCTISAKYHPFQRSSRAKGNKSLSMALVEKFQCRAAGYVSLKSEDTLKGLGLVSKQSKFGTKTALEYTTRLLSKTSSFLQELCGSGERVLNFCFDAAMVGEESVALWETPFGQFGQPFQTYKHIQVHIQTYINKYKYIYIYLFSEIHTFMYIQRYIYISTYTHQTIYTYIEGLYIDLYPI